MNKNALNILFLVGALSTASISHAMVFTCPVLHPNEIYYYFGWIDSEGNKYNDGKWNDKYWRLWINGDSYMTPKDMSVSTTPLNAIFFASTNSWYLKCTSADLSVGPRNNVWGYSTCKITKTGFDCQPSAAAPVTNSPVTPPNSAVKD